VLDALERGTIAAAELDAARVQRLVEHADESVRARAGRVFGRFAQGDRQAVLEQYQRAGELEGDGAHGEKLFTKTCSVCHRLRGVGYSVGPDLAPLVNKTPEYLLLAMLDPSRAVDSRYLSYAVVTNDGRTVTGMLAEESGGSITLAMQEGKQQTILRGDIDELRSTGKSLMPDGVEKDLSVQDMADIIAFLRASPPDRVATVGAAAEPSKPFAGNEPRLVEPDESGRLLLLATNGRIYGGDIGFEEPFRNIGFWHGDGDHVDWTVNTRSDATYDVWLVYACDGASAGNRFVLTGGAEPLRGEVAGTGGWDQYRRQPIGSLRLSAGEHRFSMWPDGVLTRPALLDLHGLEFVPVGKEPKLPPPAAVAAVAVAADPKQIAAQILNEAVPAAQREALVAAHPGLAADLIAAMSADLPAGTEEYRRIPWIWRVAIAAGKRDDAAEVRAILALSLPGPERPLRDWQAVVIGGGIINGISQQNVWPRERIAELFKDHDELVARWDRLLELASRMADDEQVPTGTRYDALRIIGCGGWESHGAQLQKYLPQGTNDELQMGAVSGLVDVHSPQATEALVGAIKYLKGTNRELALDGLLRDAERAGALLDVVMRGELGGDELGVKRVQALLEYADAEVRTRAALLLSK
jgi:putative heme-binding domain-containing protein